MKGCNMNLPKMLIYCLMALTSFACDSDEDDVDVTVIDEIKYNDIQLRGATQVPAVPSSGSGILNATYSRDTRRITFTVSWTLGSTSDNLVGMHFHGPALPTGNAPIVIDVTPPTSNRNYQGTYSSNTRELTETEEDQLLDGELYFDVHSTTYPDGELRGQVNN